MNRATLPLVFTMAVLAAGCGGGPKGKGHLEIEVQPPGGKIFVEGEYQGTNRAAVKDLDAPFEYFVKVQPPPGFQMLEKKVKVEPGKTTKKTLSLVKQGAPDPAPAASTAAASAGGPLPRVALETNQGRIVIELFEDEAPNTVANFVKLVQDGFYDGLTFHSRSENELNRGWMQGGSPSGTETGTARFTIPDELNESLSHRRGTLAMAGRRDGVANSASCQFFVCFDPQPQLDGKFTIFGRVVTGLEELEKLTPPATIRKATVVRKRDHDYTPKRMPK